MKWLLLPLTLLLLAPAFSQGTLKIYVATDDERNDMDIIDLNTSAISNYGVSVDSTNINFYTTTMSTQVVRLHPDILFEPEGPDAFLEEPTASQELILTDDMPESIVVSTLPSSLTAEERGRPDEEIRSSDSQRTRMVSNRKKSNRHKRSKSLKKTKRFKKYRGKCPTF